MPCIIGHQADSFGTTLNRSPLRHRGLILGARLIECGREACTRWQVACGLAYILRMALTAHCRSLLLDRSRWRSLLRREFRSVASCTVHTPARPTGQNRRLLRAAHVAVPRHTRREFYPLNNDTGFRQLEILNPDQVFPVFHATHAIVFPFNNGAFWVMIQDNTTNDSGETMLNPLFTHCCTVDRFTGGENTELNQRGAVNSVPSTTK